MTGGMQPLFDVLFHLFPAPVCWFAKNQGGQLSSNCWDKLHAISELQLRRAGILYYQGLDREAWRTSGCMPTVKLWCANWAFCFRRSNPLAVKTCHDWQSVQKYHHNWVSPWELISFLPQEMMHCQHSSTSWHLEQSTISRHGRNLESYPHPDPHLPVVLWLLL